MSSPGKSNSLASESSPYLRQHATNPVDWYPWGEEAFRKAADENKPVFLSIGYSSCHWCHVMAHESFENEAVAEILNRDFICVKVDREEHPDIDALYMTATQLITQRGGWPNSVWLMPDRRPWYAGTYFPREDRNGRIGFKSLLNRLVSLWTDRHKDVEEQAQALMDALRQQHATKTSSGDVSFNSAKLIQQVQKHYQGQFDPRHGGFGDAPKFPPHSGLLLLMRTQEMSPAKETGIIITSTLDAMKYGGIYDQIGGGFHRYATDEKWLLPHFEKMLYDNALLLKVYALAAKTFNNPSYQRVVMETTDWLNREMTNPEGGFYSALDADSEGEEGKYYTWSYGELSKLLDDSTLTQFAKLYQIRPGGNFDDEASGLSTPFNIPHLLPSAIEEEVRQMDTVRETLLRQRSERVHPGLDDKIITSWNGLMISALAVAGTCLKHPPYIDMAIRARSFIATYLTTGDRLARCWSGRPSPNEGALDDYAAMALADLDLYDATGNQDFLTSAGRRISFILQEFYDHDTGELFMTSRQHPAPLIRMKDVYDQGSPSGVGLATQAFARFGNLKSDPELLEIVSKIAAGHHQIIQRSPSAVASLIEGLVMATHLDGTQHTTPEVSFTLETDHTSLSQTGVHQGTLAVILPPGWHLNPLTKQPGEADNFIDLSLVPDGSEVKISVQSTGATSWTVKAQMPTNHRWASDRLNFLIKYQPCTESECLPLQQKELMVRLTPENHGS